MRERGAWEGGTRGGPPFRLRAPPAFSRRRKAAGPLGGGRPFAFGASCAGFAGLSAAFCMSPIRVARFWRVGVLKGASGSMPLAFDVLAPCSLSGQGRGTSSRGFAGELLVRLSDIAGKSFRMFPRTPNMYQGIGLHATEASSQPFAGSHAILLPGRPPRRRGALAGSGCRAWRRWPCGGRWRCCGRCRARRR